MLTRIPTKNRICRLNARQRKKRRLGEFRELCFDVKITFKEPLAAPSYDAWWEAVIDLVESRQLLICGLGGRLPLRETDGIVVAAGRGSPSEEDRKALLVGLQALPEVAGIELGDFYDAWYAE
ncbi:50S ribosome-binding protein YggL [Achromobacter sp.]|uniref:50S ribosome-binding protein YggL n=1 Tax=Achromobacter sp. TaxID=134375 RepID=UPI002F91C270